MQSWTSSIEASLTHLSCPRVPYRCKFSWSTKRKKHGMIQCTGESWYNDISNSCARGLRKGCEGKGGGGGDGQVPLTRTPSRFYWFFGCYRSVKPLVCGGVHPWFVYQSHCYTKYFIPVVDNSSGKPWNIKIHKKKYIYPYLFDCVFFFPDVTKHARVIKLRWRLGLYWNKKDDSRDVT